jgi:hypothetical protein
VERINSFSEPEMLRTLVAIIESQQAEIEALKASNQELRDEINHLKGEQGKVTIRKNKGGNSDISSETERKCGITKQKQGRKERNSRVEITREEVCEYPKDQLPPDAVFKGYRDSIVQDIKIVPDNIRFRCEVYYSPSLKKTYEASRPAGYDGEFGPNVRALILVLKHHATVSEPSIHSVLNSYNCYISSSTISRLSRKDSIPFQEEKKDIVKAGLLSSSYQHIDDTGARVNGIQYKTHILCNEYYTAYFTRPHKDRLTVLKILMMDQKLRYQFDSAAFDLMETLKIPIKIQQYLRANISSSIINEEELQPILNSIPTNNKNPDAIYRRIKEASAISWYQKQDEWPIVNCLVSDDAPQFRHITVDHALCWIHAGRTIKKLNPITPLFRSEVDDKVAEFWTFYHELMEYKENPNDEKRNLLEKKFDHLVVANSKFLPLKAALGTIEENKDKLLQVLNDPKIPLHNNPAELGARAQVRKRDVSLHTITKDGTEAVDALLTIVQSAKKLGINVVNYIQDTLVNKTMERMHITILKKAGLPRENMVTQ